MTAITAAVVRQERAVQNKVYGYGIVGTGVTIPQGALVVQEITGDLRIMNATDGANVKFVGIAEETVTGTQTGGETVKFSYGHEVLIACDTGVTKAYIGATLMVDDNNTVDIKSATTNDVEVGELVELPSSSTAWVAVRKFTNAYV